MSAKPIPGDSSGKQRLFPLHLSPIEIFMLADDQLGYPMSFAVKLWLSGTVDRTAFESALAEALQRHPLLQALIKAGKGDLPCWMPAGDVWPDFDWGGEGTPIVCQRGEHIDLSKEIGLRLWVRQGTHGANVLLQFHHACCDGTGAYRFIGDLLAGYGIRTAVADQRPVLGSVEEKLLRTRKQHALGAGAATGSALRRLAIKEGWKILANRPAVLAPPAAASCNGSPPLEFPGFLYSSFDRAEHQRLRDAAGRCGATLNDLLLRDLFLTMDRWNGRPWFWPRRGRLAIMMPTDQRDTEDYEMPAANMTSYTFLMRRVHECAAPEKLLRSIRNETALIKHQRSGTVFMETILVGSKVRWLLPFLLSRNLCLATAVLSNAADPSRRFTARFPRQSGRVVCGNLVLEEITGVPPLRRKTRATFSISQYNHRLTISLRCDPRLFRSGDTRALLSLYVERLQQSAEIGQSAPNSSPARGC